MEFLRKALGEELFVKVSKALEKEPKIKLADLGEGMYVSKDKYDALQRQTLSLKERLDSEIRLKETFSKMCEDLKKSFEEEKIKAQKLLEEEKLNNLVNIALLESGARNSRALWGLIEMEKVRLENGRLTGLEEQLVRLKEEEAYLFKEEAALSYPGTGRMNPPVQSAGGDFLRQMMGLI